MKFMPRILPLVGVAIGGVIAINAIAGASDLPNLLSGARAWAEEAAKPVKTPKAKAGKTKDAKTDGQAAEAGAAPTGDAVNTAASGIPSLPPPSIKPQAICAPTAAELAKEAGLSPAELQVLQNLGARRGELDARENDLSTQMALLAAAEEKLDAKAKALEGLKTDVQNLLNQADGREQTEIDRLVTVFQGMKPKDAAPRLVLLDDAIRLPIAAKMKPRALSAILAQMAPTDAKKITEGLAKRFSSAQTLAQNGIAAANAQTPAAAPVQAAAAPAAPKAQHAKQVRKPRPRKHVPASKQAAADKPAAAPAASASTPAAAPAAAPTAAATPPAAPAAKAG